VAAPLEIRTVISSQMGAVGSGTAAIGVVGFPSIKDGLAVLLWRVVMPVLRSSIRTCFWPLHWVQPPAPSARKCVL